MLIRLLNGYRNYNIEKAYLAPFLFCTIGFFCCSCGDVTTSAQSWHLLETPLSAKLLRLNWLQMLSFAVDDLPLARSRLNCS